MNIHKSQLFWGSLGTRVLTHPHFLYDFYFRRWWEWWRFFGSRRDLGRWWRCWCVQIWRFTCLLIHSDGIHCRHLSKSATTQNLSEPTLPKKVNHNSPHENGHYCGYPDANHPPTERCGVSTSRVGFQRFFTGFRRCKRSQIWSRRHADGRARFIELQCCEVPHVQNNTCSRHFWRCRCRKSARRCGAKHISKSKCTKHSTFGPLWTFRDRYIDR